MARYVNPVQQISDGNGKPLVGAELSFYEPKTTTLKTIYSDAGLTIPRANPAVSDEDGRWGTPAEGGAIFLDGIYRTIGRDASGALIPGLDSDPVGDVIEGEWQLWISDTIYEISQIVRGSDDEFYRSLVNSNQGNDPTSSPASWEQLKLMREWNTNVTYAATNNAFGSDGNLYRSVTSSNQGNDPTLDTLGTNWASALNAFDTFPIAGLLPWTGGLTPPPNFLLANAAIISRATYPILSAIYAALTPTYPFGNGDGSTTFQLPGMAGNFPIGADTTYTIGQTGGATTHLLTEAEMPSHIHQVPRYSPSGVTDHIGDITGSMSIANRDPSDSTGGDVAHSILNPFLAVRYIVRVQ